MVVILRLRYAFTKHKMNSWKLSYPGRMRKSREAGSGEKSFPKSRRGKAFGKIEEK